MDVINLVDQTMIDHNDSSVVLDEEESKSFQMKNQNKVHSIKV